MTKKRSQPSESSAADFVALEKTMEKASQGDIMKDKKVKKKRKKQANKRGVVLVSHIPYGFFEPQMFDFFSQFGRVTRLKLIRSRKTGKTRQFAFVEFQFEEVAKVAAETMNNYLMLQKILKCKLIPLEEVRHGTFQNWQYRYHVPRTRSKAIAEHNAPLVDPEKIERKKQKTLVRRQALQEKLVNLGIDYDVLNITVNTSFVPPARTRATPEDVKNLRAKTEILDERCSDYEYSDEEPEVDEQEGKPEDKADEIKESIPENSDSRVENQTPGPQAKLTSPKEGISVPEDESEFGVMVVDLDDSEVTFKSPPAEAKITRRSVRLSKVRKSASTTPDNESVDKSISPKVSPKPKRVLRLKKMKKDLDSIDQGSDDVEISEETPVKSLFKRKKNSASVEKSAKKISEETPVKSLIKRKKNSASVEKSAKKISEETPVKSLIKRKKNSASVEEKSAKKISEETPVKSLIKRKKNSANVEEKSAKKISEETPVKSLIKRKKSSASVEKKSAKKRSKLDKTM